MKTKAGIELTIKEERLVNDLQRLADRWKKDGKRLWLFSAAGTLHVMMEGDIETNPEPYETNGGSVSQENCIKIISGIRNDGGDW